MNKRMLIVLLSFGLFLFLLSCKKLYNPKIVSTNNNYLVVEGNINTGSDSTSNDVQELIYGGYQSPISPVESGGVIVGFYSSTPFCVDCTLYGTSTNIRPDYWTDYQ